MDFSIIYKDESNITNLSLEFIPTINKTKDYFIQMLKNNNKIYYKKSFHDLEKLNCKIKTKEKNNIKNDIVEKKNKIP